MKAAYIPCRDQPRYVTAGFLSFEIVAYIPEATTNLSTGQRGLILSIQASLSFLIVHGSYGITMPQIEPIHVAMLSNTSFVGILYLVSAFDPLKTRVVFCMAVVKTMSVHP